MKPFLNSIHPPLFSVILCLITGILAGNAWPDLSVWAFVSVSFLVLLGISLFLLGLKPFVFLMGFLAMSWGFFSMGQTLNPKVAPGHISHYMDGSRVIITGKVLSFTNHYPRKKRILLSCQVLEKKGMVKTRVHGLVRVNIYDSENISFSFGDLLKFQSPLKPIRNFSNPHGFDYERHMKFQGISGSAYASGKKIQVIPLVPIPFSIKTIRTLEQLRNDFFHFALDRLDNKNAAAILVALVTGKKEVIPLEVRDLFSQAGGSHILAISGLHLSIVALGFFFLFYTLLARFSGALVTGGAKKAAGILTLVPLLLYAVFSGFSPSTQRALIMTASFMICFLMEKEHHPLNTLALAAVVILIVDCSALFTISFQLSFFAVLFILLGFSLVKNPGWMPKNRLAAMVITASMVSFFAGLGTFPLIAHYFNLVSYVQILANLLLVPLMGFICLPLGFLALLSLPVCQPLALFLAKLCQGILVFCQGYIEFLTGFPFSWTRIVTPSLLEVILVYLFLTGIFFWFSCHKKWGGTLMAMALAAGLVCAGAGVQARFFPEKLAITLLDVGQGNAALIRTRSGKAILVDGGGFSDNSEFDVGRMVVAPFLWSQKILNLDAIVLTHPESDHMNGLVFILKNFRVGLLVKNRDDRLTGAYLDLIALCDQKKIDIRVPSPHEPNIDFKNTGLHFYGSGPESSSYNLNNNSLVFQVRFHEFSLLFPGDILKEREAALVKQHGLDLASRILVSPHHGSISSNQKKFLDMVNPESVVISCGYDNRYGFPHPEVVKRYQERGSRIFRTDLDGAITISSDGFGYEILTHKGR